MEAGWVGVAGAAGLAAAGVALLDRAGQDFAGAGECGEFGGDLAGFVALAAGSMLHRASSLAEGSVIPSVFLSVYVLCDGAGWLQPRSVLGAVIARYAPRSLSAAAAAFARAVVAQAGAGDAGAGEGAVVRRGQAGRVRRVGRARARAAGGALRGGDRAVRAGRLRGRLAGDPADAADEPAGAGAGARALSAAVAGAAGRASARSGRTRRREIDGFLRLADAQSTPGAPVARERADLPGRGRGGDRRRAAARPRQRRRRALGRGARARSAARARGRCRSSSATSSGCWRRPRSPASGYVIGGRNPDRRNVTDTLSAALSTDQLAAPLAGRAVALDMAGRSAPRRIGLGAFMHAAGITCSQRLGDLAAATARRRARTSWSRCSGGSP